MEIDLVSLQPNINYVVKAVCSTNNNLHETLHYHAKGLPKVEEIVEKGIKCNTKLL